MGKLFSDLQTSNEVLESIRFSPDSKYVVTAAAWTAPVWLTATGQHIADLSGHTGRVLSASFSPTNGKVIVTRSADKMVRVFTCAVCGSLADLTALANDRLQLLKRRLTPEERDRYLPASRK
jgi:WD40 repeat protein